MDFGPLIGIGIALVCILVGNSLEGGHLGSMVGGPAAMIVLGGTMGAVIVQFSLATVGDAVKAVGGLFKKSPIDAVRVVDELVDYANRARREGILGLEKLAPNASHPFLAKSLMMAIDGADSAAIRATMEVVISEEEEHGEEAAKVWEAGGGYSPTVGIIGAVLGLIHVMSNLSDINAVGHGIAAAFVATIYGVAVANIIFLPLAGRIKSRVKEQAKIKEMMLVGVLAIQEGTNPKLLRDRLEGFVHSHAAAKKKEPAGVASRAAA